MSENGEERRIMRRVPLSYTNETLERMAVLAEERNPDYGGGSHYYEVHLDGKKVLEINFQKGPVKESGLNGILEEVLMAVLVDRYQSFQEGKYACRENAIALTHLQDAQNWSRRRADSRARRGVLGTWQV